MLLGEFTRPASSWLPSFRVGSWGTSFCRPADSQPGQPFTVTELRSLDNWLGGHGVGVLVKLHPRDLGAFPDDLRALRLFTNDDLEQQDLTTHTALAAFDGLINDLSSVWVDYLLLDRPIIFAFPDVENYRRGRGLNLEPYEDRMPGPFARSMDELIAALAEVVAGGDPAAAERGRARLRFCRHTDDRSTQRLLQTIGIDTASAAPPTPGLEPVTAAAS